jgi:hypothetical protein
MVRALLGAAAILAAGCDLNGGAQVYPGAVGYEAPGADFRFYYLAPPWRPAAAEADVLVHLAIDVFGQFTSTDKAVSHELRVSYAAGFARGVVEAQRDALVRDGATARREVGPLRSLTGESGWDFEAERATSKGQVYYRETAYTTVAGKAVRFSLRAAYPTDEQDVQDLLESFSTRGPVQ